MIRAAALLAVLAGTAAAAPDRNSDGSAQVLPPGPADEPGKTLVLGYDDFGPQGEAYELIGFDRWSWGECACYEPGDSFDIRVVVYHGVSRAHVAARYPTVEGRADYRYVERDQALAYLARVLADNRADPDLVEMTVRLIDTRAHIVAALGRPRR